MEVVIITRSIVLQQGLSALIESLPGMMNVKAIKELSNAYIWIESHRPNIVLLDVALLRSEIRIVLEKFQMISPGTQRVLLVDDIQTINWVPEYAEAILIKGVSPSAVAALLTNLLSSKGEENEHKDSDQ